MTYHEWLWNHREHFLSEAYTIREIIRISMETGWTHDEMKPILEFWPRALHVKATEDLRRERVTDSDYLYRVYSYKRQNGPCFEDMWKEYRNYANGKSWD